MEDPVAEIPHVIHLLTQSIPSVQKETIERFFTPSASFTHPLCRTGSFEGSRWLIVQIYRFYKIMSPRIDLDVHSVAFDKSNLTLYVTVSQLFRIFIIPFYKANVRLTVVLTLTPSTTQTTHAGTPTFIHPSAQPQTPTTTDTADHSLSSSWISASDPNNPDSSPNADSTSRTLYYISAQEDLYQASEVIKFVLPFGIGLVVTFVWQCFSTFFCVFMAFLLAPVSWAEERELLPLEGGWRIRRGLEERKSKVGKRE
ncbi:hypothetical protein AJ79_09771 [Helicocarpus griseus UAMH5409]|uniref:SigF-like NTF2-like domain-containing protein n=1 Tax=Helicocarpus griseus UAMH5409 TaxID=1447875 RepID=A0A2B7WHF5_9EURO|nr:hypothetical protein AJ79_09771 [Helicocarpus griseus UAMH5409]